MAGGRLDLLVVGHDVRRDAAADYRVHQPLPEVAAADSADPSIVLHAEQDSAAVHVRQRHELLGEPIGADIVALELGLRAFAGADDREELGCRHDAAGLERLPAREARQECLVGVLLEAALLLPQHRGEIAAKHRVQRQAQSGKDAAVNHAGRIRR